MNSLTPGDPRPCKTCAASIYFMMMGKSWRAVDGGKGTIHNCKKTELERQTGAFYNETNPDIKYRKKSR